MFSSVIEAARNNPFKTQVQCESSDNTQLVSTRTIAAADALPGDSCEFGSLQYFALCGIGGILSCGSTHTFVVPLDLVKCRLQVDPAKYGNIFKGFKVSVAEEGARGLAKGWAPTLLGYSAQGLFKFGLYEVFKVKYAEIIGEENSYLYRTGLYLAASASAEFFADMGKLKCLREM